VSRSDAIDFLLLSAIWGASFLFMRVAVPEFGPFALIGLRSGLAALCLWPLLLARGRETGWGPVRTHLRELTVVGVVNALIPFTLFAYAALSLTAGFTALINASTPLWTALVGVLWGGSGLAVVAGLIATLAYGISTHYTKRKLAAVSPLGVAAGSQTTGALMLLPLAVIYWPAASPSLKAWIAAILLAVLATAFALILYFRLISRVGGQKASTVTFLIPVFAIGWGAALLGEGVTGPMLAGGAVVLLGTALTLGILRLPGTNREDLGKAAQKL